VRGVWGFQGELAPPVASGCLQIRRHVPMVTIIVETPERIASSFQIVDEMTDDAGLVPALAALAGAEPSNGGLRLARHRF
jgi:PII-like signaling protein